MASNSYSVMFEASDTPHPEAVLAMYDPASPMIVCHRAHKILVGADGVPRPYREWFRAVTAPDTSPALVATGCGGVLYFPESLHADVCRKELFLELVE